MRWLRGIGKRRIPQDPAQQQVMLRELRQRFGPHAGRRFAAQSEQAAALLAGPDGLVVAATVLREFADAAFADVAQQAAALGLTPDRRNYRPVWEAAGKRLRSPLFTGLAGFHPYVHVAAAVSVVGGQAAQTVRLVDPLPLLTHMFEVLDLTLAGWEFGRVLVDVDGATLAVNLIQGATAIRGEMSDPPPLPQPARTQMRSNRSVNVLDPTVSRIVGQWNPGKQMRECLLA
ncbi:hypothetical protein ACWT_4522 [Actinoplanes sp. SE50]|uniref:hypothetical protein n=1 Tax=unclassified Actinoplanes TaxID=2626549 RepID=UPI00023ED0BB|nr:MULTISPECIES: hypothetical protein [unclassified Actinoplanes]AEV85544.1 hypothetical protein ACPL_4653 [Actinoplanes sp. SE50/110]ATO83937.1 hypothetical protein ACWT_4522 [Actinoplanes sp. SE50]SLM01347.1 hypothetical protein ACSP50_4583 [Actinoplanes sp. SE50/110]